MQNDNEGVQLKTDINVYQQNSHLFINPAFASLTEIFLS